MARMLLMATILSWAAMTRMSSRYSTSTRWNRGLLSTHSISSRVLPPIVVTTHLPAFTVLSFPVMTPSFTRDDARRGGLGVVAQDLLPGQHPQPDQGLRGPPHPNLDGIAAV